MMKTQTIFTAFLFAMVTSIPALAQNSIGEASVEGRSITIYDDFTWAYADGSTPAQSSDCFNALTGIEFCGAPLGWKGVPDLSPFATASYMLDERNYAMTIEETLGLIDGVSLDSIEDTVIQGFATGAKVNVRDVDRYGSDELEMFGNPARTLVYGGQISGLSVIYYNTIWVSQTTTTQFLTFTIVAEPTAESRKLHTDSLNAMNEIE